MIKPYVPKLINFIVEGRYTGTKQYITEEGMTWREWVNSKYNDTSPDGYLFFVSEYDNTEYVCSGGNTISYVLRHKNDKDIYISPDEIIISDFTYWYNGER